MSMPSFEESAKLRRRQFQQRIFDVESARETLVLLRRVMADIVDLQTQISGLDRSISQLPAVAGQTPQQKRDCFALHDERDRLLRRLNDAKQEAKSLGVAALNTRRGYAGFPSIVNGALAFLVYRHADGDIRYWRYRDLPKLRPIPAAWYGETEPAPEPTNADRPQGIPAFLP